MSARTVDIEFGYDSEDIEHVVLDVSVEENCEL